MLAFHFLPPPPQSLVLPRLMAIAHLSPQLAQEAMTRVTRCMQRGIEIKLGNQLSNKARPPCFREGLFPCPPTAASLSPAPHTATQFPVSPPFLSVPMAVSHHQRTEVSLWKPPIFFLPVMLGNRAHMKFWRKIWPWRACICWLSPSKLFWCTSTCINTAKELFTPHMLEKNRGVVEQVSVYSTANIWC